MNETSRGGADYSVGGTVGGETKDRKCSQCVRDKRKRSRPTYYARASYPKKLRGIVTGATSSVSKNREKLTNVRAGTPAFSSALFVRIIKILRYLAAYTHLVHSIPDW